MDNVNECKQSPTLVSPMQGTVWKKIESSFGDKLVFPVGLFNDDFEVNNCLGPHKNKSKLGGVYLSLPFIPEKYRSTVNNIYLAQIHKSKDHANEGNQKIFCKIIEKLKLLEETGISLHIDGVKIQVYFSLLYVLGDNLGLNTLLGFMKSFSPNVFYNCRFCIADRDERQSLCDPEENKLRRNNEYAVGQYGIQEICIFNQLRNFNAKVNMVGDSFHDLEKGTCEIVMGKVLNRLIYQDECFSLDALNWAIKYFDYGPTRDFNRPEQLTEKQIQSGNLSFTGSEMKTFMIYLCAYVGDFVPEENEAWQLYLLLRQIMFCVRSSSFSKQKIEHLRKLIHDHNNLYNNLEFGPLTYKLHVLGHYPLMTTELGPPIFYDTARYEAKHQQLKKIAAASKSRKNITKTVAHKEQLHLCEILMSNRIFEDALSWGPITATSIKDLGPIDGIDSTMFTDADKELIITSWVSLHGTFYKENICIVLSGSNEDSYPNFGKIIHIVLNENQEIKFLYQEMKTLEFLYHYQAFQVENTNTWGTIDQNSLIVYKPRNIITLQNGKRNILAM